MKDSVYHSCLRIASLTVAFVLVFESGLANPVTKELSLVTHEYLGAAVGASASVQPTELNQMTARFAQMERDLEAREAALSQREIEVNLNTGGETADNEVAIYILSVVLFILLVLIILNYFLDYLRRNPVPKRQYEQTA